MYYGEWDETDIIGIEEPGYLQILKSRYPKLQPALVTAFYNRFKQESFKINKPKGGQSGRPELMGLNAFQNFFRAADKGLAAIDKATGYAAGNVLKTAVTAGANILAPGSGQLIDSGINAAKSAQNVIGKITAAIPTESKPGTSSVNQFLTSIKDSAASGVKTVSAATRQSESFLKKLPKPVLYGGIGGVVLISGLVVYKLTKKKKAV